MSDNDQDRSGNEPQEPAGTAADLTPEVAALNALAQKRGWRPVYLDHEGLCVKIARDTFLEVIREDPADDWVTSVHFHSRTGDRDPHTLALRLAAALIVVAGKVGGDAGAG
jgi:hypothetical protein